MKICRKRTKFVKYSLHILGILFCTLPPILCTLHYFPLWNVSGEKTLAGGVLLLIIISLIPFYKDIKRRLSNIASYVLWLILFLLFFFLSKIAEEMTVISFFGFIGNLLGALCIRLGKRGEKNELE